MTGLLTLILGRLPIGWLQLAHSRLRFGAALAGVAFANILIFMQLGFLGALSESTRLPYRIMDADVLIYSPETNTLADAGTIPRQRMLQARAVDGVSMATPVYVGTFVWDQEGGGSSSLRVFGVDPEAMPFRSREITDLRDRLRLEDVALLDRRSRSLSPRVVEQVNAGTPYRFETAGRTISIEGIFSVGAGFDADGYMIVSDQTFLRLFPNRSSAAPNYIFARITAEFHPALVVEQLRDALPAKDTVVRTLADAASADQSYQLTQRPVGVVFGFGVVIGILVGIIIVYQVLSTDVADHLAEYATFKAIGYRQGFFLGIVFEEAMILALIGFVPGIVVSQGLYVAAASVTGLPVVMTLSRAVLVLFGTVIMCSISGAIATRRLAAADPADLF